MSKQIKSVRVGRPTGRELVLAGLGAVSLGRKQVQKTYRTLVAEGADARAALAQRAGQLRRGFDQRVTSAREAVAPVVADMRGRVEGAVEAVGARVQPVLVRYGIAAAPTRGRKQARSAAPRKSGKPAAKRAPVKAAPKSRRGRKAA